MIGKRLNATPIVLHASAATLDGTGTASITAWADATYFPQTAWLRFTNDGATELTIGGASIPAMLRIGGVPAAVLFDGRLVTLDPGDSIWSRLPADIATLGAVWSVDAPATAAGTVSVSVRAYYVETSEGTALEHATLIASTLATAHGGGSWTGSGGGATADDIANAVRDKALAGASAGSIGAALGTLLTGVAALPAANTIATAVLAATLEAGVTVADGLRLLLSVNLGRRIINGTTQTFRNLANTKDRVVAVVYGDGTRTVTSTADGT